MLLAILRRHWGTQRVTLARSSVKLTLLSVLLLLVVLQVLQLLLHSCRHLWLGWLLMVIRLCIKIKIKIVRVRICDDASDTYRKSQLTAVRE